MSIFAPMSNPISIKTFRNRAYRKKKSLLKVLKKLSAKRSPDLDRHMKSLAQNTWNEIDCLECANCCKTMTPTFTRTDLKRISAHFGMSTSEFYTKWLATDENKDIVNENTPCQFLGKDNKCSIYEIRPRDCRSFPHFHKRPFLDQYEVLEQNLHRCPATLVMVEKIEALALESGWIKKA